MDDQRKEIAGQPIILPYSKIIGQEQLKLALELSYLAPRLGGVLIAGQRGTAKSTAVRAFALMMYGQLPVTLPINATEDRVIGGWEVNELMQGKAKWKEGLLKDADASVLYVDEVNLLDDHLVNLILDASSTGVLVVQREGKSRQEPVSFSLIGTMNPEEGSLRPQLLDRFGLLVSVKGETDPERRQQILSTVMDFDEAVFQRKVGHAAPFLDEGLEQDRAYRASLTKARARVLSVEVPEKIAGQCISLAAEFNIEGHRGDYVLALAGRALAALEGKQQVTAQHLESVASLALHHRRREFLQSGQWYWSADDDQRVAKVLSA